MDGKSFEPIYFLHDNLDVVLDEKGSQFIALRKIQWVKDVKTPKDPEKAKYEIRRWRVNDEGESPAKGVVFLTDEGPNNCVTGLIENGFGDTREILRKISTREDFRHAVETMYDEIPDSVEGDFFDARELLLNE